MFRITISERPLTCEVVVDVDQCCLRVEITRGRRLPGVALVTAVDGVIPGQLFEGEKVRVRVKEGVRERVPGEGREQEKENVNVHHKPKQRIVYIFI